MAILFGILWHSQRSYWIYNVHIHNNLSTVFGLKIPGSALAIFSMLHYTRTLMPRAF